MNFNDKDGTVETLQGKLLRLGYALPEHGADGHLGDETWEVLRQYARDHRLPWVPEVPEHILTDIRQGATSPDIPIFPHNADPVLDDVRFIHIENEAPDPHPKSRIRGRRTLRRTPSSVDGITLHQMAVEMGPGRHYLGMAGGDWGLAFALRAQLGPAGSKKGGVAAPLCVHDDLVACTAPLDWYLYHGNALCGPTIGIEVSGRFSGLLDDPTTVPREDLRTTWGDEPPMKLELPRIRAVCAAIRYAVEEGRRLGMPIRFIYAHRQSNGKKPGDPGEALWQAAVIDYAVAVLGLTPRYDFTAGTGRPIPREWDANGVGGYR